MKFKKVSGETFRRIEISDNFGDTLHVETNEADQKSDAIWFITNGAERPSDLAVRVTRAKALKLAWAIIDELNPSQLG